MTRYAIYTRVSTTLESQASSFENQNTDLEARVKELYPDYKLVRVYGDYGISGAKENRPEFNKMISDAIAGDFDVIISKSISRFARNTELLLRTVNKLKKHGVGVIFLENSNIDTRKESGMFIITVLAAIADEERKNTKAHIQETYAMKHAAGKMAKPFTKAYGYRIVNSEPVIVEEEAEVVRKIFSWFVNDGVSVGTIARRLNANKIHSPRYKTGKGWCRSEIKNLLGNSKYCGRPKETSKTGEELYFEGPAIIDEATYNIAKKLLEDYSRQPKIVKMRAMASNFQPQKYPLSGLCKCAVCGGKASRYTRKSTLTTGKYPLDLCEPAVEGTPLWGCLRNGSTLYGTKCFTYKISEQYLYEMIIEAISRCFAWKFEVEILTADGKKTKKQRENIGIDLYNQLIAPLESLVITDQEKKYNEAIKKYHDDLKDIDRKTEYAINAYIERKDDGKNVEKIFERKMNELKRARQEAEQNKPSTPDEIRISNEQMTRIKGFFVGKTDDIELQEAFRILFKDRETRRALVRALVEEVKIGGDFKYMATIKIRGFDKSLVFSVDERAPRRWPKHMSYNDINFIGTV